MYALDLKTACSLAEADWQPAMPSRSRRFAGFSPSWVTRLRRLAKCARFWILKEPTGSAFDNRRNSNRKDGEGTHDRLSDQLARHLPRWFAMEVAASEHRPRCLSGTAICPNR